MEASYCTYRFGAIIQSDLRTQSLPRDSLRDNLYVCVCVIKSTWEKQLTLNEIAWRA